MQEKNSTHAEKMRPREALHLHNTTTRQQTKPTREGRRGEWRGGEGRGGEAKHRNRTAPHRTALRMDELFFKRYLPTSLFLVNFVM
jgi:hypothetical protein